MIILVLGALLIVVGVSQLSFPDMVNSIKENDHQQWTALGSPPAYAFSKTMGVFSWVLSRGYENSQSPEVVALGRKSLKKALTAKYALLAGVALLASGFVVALVGA